MAMRETILEAARAECERHARLHGEKRLLAQGAFEGLLERFRRRARSSLWVLVPGLLFEGTCFVIAGVLESSRIRFWIMAIAQGAVVVILACLLFWNVSHLRRWTRVLRALRETDGTESSPPPSGNSA
jgi:hypothetical protein